MPTHESQPLLEACLIVRNESEHLAGCLESLRSLGPLIGAIRVYDTGSTDETVSIASEAACDVVQGAWHEDFALARNSALDLCRSTWALCIDADERVLADPLALAAALDESADVDVLNAVFIHVDSAGRIIGSSSYAKFVRVETVRFVGRVHEVPARNDTFPLRVADLEDSQVTFRHLGYATSDLRRAKAQRNAALAQADAELACASADRQWIGETHYHLGRSLLTLDANERALDALEKAWDAFPRGSLGRERTISMLVPTQLRLGRMAEALDRVAAHVDQGGSTHHVRLLLAKVSLAASRPADALTSLSSIPPEGDVAHEVTPRDVLSVRLMALDRLDRRDEALACCLVLVSEHGDLVRVRELLARASGQSPVALATLLAAAVDRPWFAALIGELRHQSGLGEQVARQLSLCTE